MQTPSGPSGLIAVAAAALLALTGCGGPAGSTPQGGATGQAEAGSYSVMAEWDGCTVLDDIKPIEEFMGVTDWGTTGLMTTGIPGGLDGEAYNCTGSATLPAYHLPDPIASRQDLPGSGDIDVGGVPWDSVDEAAENFTSRVDQLKDSIATGGTDYTNVLEGPFPEAGDWDETYYHAGTTSTGYALHAIARKGDLVLYVFIDYIEDFGTQMDDDPVYPFTDAELVAWVLDDYMPTTHADLLAQKAAATP